MLSVEDKLAEFRAQKRKRERIETIKHTVSKLNIFQRNQNEKLTSKEISGLCHQEPSAELEKPSWNPLFKYSSLAILWITLFILFVKLEFGIVYVIVSSLCIIWLNTRVGPKKEGEVSAYSVFNPNCEAIDGTLKAEQFEKEIRYGAGSVH